MTSTPSGGREQRNKRGMIMVVGDASRCLTDSTVDELGRALGRRTLHVLNVFEAIGELSRASAREPVEVMLITDELLDGSPDQAAQAFRVVDPAVRLVHIATSGNQRPEGFDDSLRGPLTAANVSRLIEGEPTQSDATGDDVPCSSTTVTNDSAESPATDDVPSPQPRAAEGGVDAPFAATTIEAQPRDDFEPEPDELPEQLGDTDLLQAVLAGGDALADMAVELIRQQTNWSDVELLEESATAHGAVVRLHGETYGRLCSATAESRQLADWADWLAQWLAMNAQHRRYRHMAFHDELTDAWNRRYFDMFLSESMAIASRRRRPVTVMVLDIDDFKVYNDSYGHAAGDEILRETVRLLTSVIRKGDRVCRIGGDEFAVIFADLEGPREVGSAHPESVEQIAQRFQEQICRMNFPKLGADALATLSVSAGLATYPWDGSDPQALLEHADQLALQSKRRGKNAITLGPGARQICKKRESDRG